jgi:hypothetical protein
LLFGKPDVGNLRVCVDDTWDAVVVNVTALAKNVLNGGDAFLFGFMCEHLTFDGVSDSVDAWNLGLPVVVGVDNSSVVDGDSGLFELKASGEGVTSNRDENDVGFKSLCLAIFALNVDGAALFAIVSSGQDLGAEFEVDTLLLEGALEGSADLLVKEATDSVLWVDDCDFGAQSLVDTSHLEADDATTDDDHLLRNFVK